MKIAFLLTCHNRKEQTVSSVKSVLAQKRPNVFKLDIILVDDGSTDGTAETLASVAPSIVFLKGDGSLFWNRGMHRAFAYAIAHRYDYYVWLNDDTILYDDALFRMYELTQQVPEKSILIGSVVDPDSGELTYGGLCKKNKLRKLKFSTIPPSDQLVECDTMNGNFVIIPDSVVAKTGNLDPAYTHAFGDIDYGLRAKAKVCKIWIAPGYYGTCARNRLDGGWKDTRLSLRKRLKELNSARGLPINEWKIFARKHAGFFWPVYWLSPYVRFFASHLKQKLAAFI